MIGGMEMLALPDPWRPHWKPFKSVRQRLMERVSIVPITGCWMWMGPINEHGYGRVKESGVHTQFAHRRTYEAWVGPLDPKLQIDHLCRNRWCVNPTHLEQVTQRTNYMRGDAWAKFASREGKCIRGHALVDDNVDVCTNKFGRKYRRCISCRKIWAAKKRERDLLWTSPLPRNPRLNHCKRGHPFDDENTKVVYGQRFCRACGRERDRLRRAAKRAKQP